MDGGASDHANGCLLSVLLYLHNDHEESQYFVSSHLGGASWGKTSTSLDDDKNTSLTVPLSLKALSLIFLKGLPSGFGPITIIFTTYRYRRKDTPILQKES